jgi:hypothetical protein
MWQRMMLKLWFLDSAAVAHGLPSPLSQQWSRMQRRFPFFAAEVEQLLHGDAELGPPSRSVLKQPAYRSLE